MLDLRRALASAPRTPEQAELRPLLTEWGERIAAGEERIAYTCAQLREWGLERLGACHCNGEQAARYFQEHFPGFFERYHVSAPHASCGRPPYPP